MAYIPMAPKKPRPKQSGRLSIDDRYNGRKWRKLRLQLLTAEPLCRSCTAQGRVTAAKVADHIIPVRGGGEFYDIENLQPLCDSCHAVKSAREGRAPRGGV